MVGSAQNGCLLNTFEQSRFDPEADLTVLTEVDQEAIKLDLGLSDGQLGLLTGFAFALFYATLGVPVARLADKWSRRNVLVISMTIWSAVSALCGLAANFWQLALLRIGVGVGEAGGTPP